MKYSERTEKILEGCRIAFERLVERKKREDGYLIFSDKGKIVKVKAKDIKIAPHKK